MTTLASLTPDQRNPRKRTRRSHDMIEASLRKFGAARSIVIDEEGTILAGNGTVEAAAAIGIEKVRVIPVDGNTIVAVQRCGLTATEKRELSIADNRSSDLSEFDADVLAECLEQDPDLDLSPYWSEEEFEALANGIAEDEAAAAAAAEKESDPTEERMLKIEFEDYDAKARFLEAMSRAAAFWPEFETPAARLQFVLDRALARVEPGR